MIIVMIIIIGLKTDEERFAADIAMRPEDMNVRSDAYRSVPIEEFGAAMLRYVHVYMCIDVYT
jgi:hypothetical protein